MLAKTDENLPNEAATLLRSAGWSCATVYDEGLNGAADARVGQACRNEQRVLFTLDQNFADIRTYPPRDYIGIVVLKPREPHRAAILELLKTALNVLEKDWADHQLWIFEPARYRVRSASE
jgi:predicted nuclease of predicted toxin-antitoxin system